MRGRGMHVYPCFLLYEKEGMQWYKCMPIVRGILWLFWEFSIPTEADSAHESSHTSLTSVVCIQLISSLSHPIYILHKPSLSPSLVSQTTDESILLNPRSRISNHLWSTCQMPALLRTDYDLDGFVISHYMNRYCRQIKYVFVAKNIISTLEKSLGKTYYR